MIALSNIKQTLKTLGFSASKDDQTYTKHFENTACSLTADFKNKKLIYPTEKGFTVNDGTTSNFEHPENFVVFECVCRLLEKGYRPEHIELEPRWSLGHGGKSGKADICVKNKDGSPYLAIIECKTADGEYKKELSNMKADGGQLFSYWQQSKATKWLVLYASDFEDKKVTYTTATVNCSDDANFIELAKDDKSLKLYRDATTVENLFEVWKDTYEQKFLGDIIFDEETVAYDIGILPLKKKRLVDFSRDDKIVNQFEEILRHNNVSDKENAFNRLIALFIAKLYDEKTKTSESEVDFQYKTGTDTYQTMQDRLQKLHHFGMKEFMKEDVFYVADDYIKTVLYGSLGENRTELEKELNDTITKLKFYTNNDFAFKDVHNKTLFYQNGKILVEMVELFQKYRIIDSKELQLLGDMFEQLLNKGFKQNEGQFFTPTPITSFIWKSLPLESILQNDDTREVHYPRVIDYACGAGHFLTEGFREINETVSKLGISSEKNWEEHCIYGIEKDYRLARVSKISLFMHGADNGNIVFGDGLDNHDKDGVVIQNGQFDILVANPPYSVSAFKNHLELKNNQLNLLEYISKDGKEIETLFVERIAQLLKPNGIAAVILPSSILSNSSTSYIKAREEILKNFQIHSIVLFSSKTFGATGTNTVVLFMQKNDEPPVKAKVAKDNVSAILSDENLEVSSDKEIFAEYCKKISAREDDYKRFVKDAREKEDYKKYLEDEKSYFCMYAKDFAQSSEYKTALKQDEKASLKDKNAHFENRSKAFYDFTLKTEKEKLYYFALAYRQNVLVVTAPNEDKEQEKFLGYTWSNRKGDEGIKIKSANPATSCGLLYNTDDEDAGVARYVKDSFLGIYRSGMVPQPVETTLSKYLSVAALCDMLDFSRVSFDKAIKCNVKSESGELKIESKFPMVKLGEVATLQKGKSITSKDLKEGSVKVVAGGIDFAYFHNEANRPANIITVSASGANAGFVNFWKEPIFASDCTTILAKDELFTKYIFNFLKANQEIVFHLQKGAAQPHVYADDLKSLNIPLPPLDVQKSIVAECEEVDADWARAQKAIEEAKAEIERIMSEGQKTANQTYKLSDKNIFDISIGRRVLSTEMGEQFEISVYSANVFEPFGKINKLLLKEFDVPSVLWGIDGDWQVNTIAENVPFYPTDHCGVLRIKNNQLEPKYVAWVLNKLGEQEGFKRSYRASIDRIEGLQITLPPLPDQQKIVRRVSEEEAKIADAKAGMASCPKRKKSVLAKWL